MTPLWARDHDSVAREVSKALEVSVYTYIRT